ncbi:MAG: glycosyltransferase, partial [Paludibacteraceae bacterium]|nr:glycosyltransferase [Paludibacteraceae bacterium]
VYPAASWKYKNHRFLADIVDAIKRLHPEMITKVRIHLTLKCGENKGLELLLKEKGLSSCFFFHGAIPRDELLAMLNASHGLVFPSQIETLGLPLLEAAGMGKSIIAADLPYAHQVLGDYPGSIFVDVNDPDAWAEKLHSMSISKPGHFTPMSVPTKSSWDSFFELID